MALPASHTVLLLGDPTDAEFADVVSVLRGSVVHSRLREAATLKTARGLYPAGQAVPDLVVVCQSWSDQFSPQDLRELLHWLPLARVVCCAGPWCDSDGRNRELWPLAVRTPAADGALSVARELAALDLARPVQTPSRPREPDTAGGADRSRQFLPLTASRTEIYHARFTPHGGDCEALRGVRASVVSPDRAWRQMVERQVWLWGATVCELPETSHSSQAGRVLLFDSDPADSRQVATLIDLKSRQPTARIVAAVGFPRADLAERLRRAGADDVWAKLSPLESLLQALCPVSLTADGRG